MSNKKASVSVTVTTAATRLCTNSGIRRGLIIAVATAATTIFLGADASVTTANGIPLKEGSPFFDFESNTQWWAIVASGTADVRVMEVQ